MHQSSAVSVGIAGLGRTGWNNHAAALRLPILADKYKVTAVADPIASRVDEARSVFGCRAYLSFDELLDDPDVELLIVATPSHLHAKHSIAALHAGKHVLCEKPMATSLKDADSMIVAAQQANRILTVNQTVRYWPDFVRVREIVESGQLGEIIAIRIVWHWFRRRWDWQTLMALGGGVLNNDGSHVVDQALLLMGVDNPDVFSWMVRTPLSAGDAEDHVKIILSSPGAPTVDIEMTNACAFPQDNWLIMGTQGGLVGNHKQLRWRYLDPRLLPPHEPSREPTPDRTYNSEKLPWREETCDLTQDPTRGHEMVYFDLYETLRGDKPLPITPQSVRNQIAVLEKCRQQSELYA